ncbi:hypothetical protein [Staphylococcus saprophyticus]|nr:hypothetical protein [Staphylococcus saprophyticus]
MKIGERGEYEESGLGLEIYSELVYSMEKEMVYGGRELFIGGRGKV